MKEVFGILGVALTALSLVPYAVAMWRRRVKPHAFSWFLWGLNNAVVCAAQAVSGAGAGLWTAAAAGLCCFAIAFYGLRFGEKNITRADWAVFVSALFALALWPLTRQPVWSVALITLVDFMGFIPTVRKSWHAPYDEVLSSFALGGAGFFFAVLALENPVFVNYCYPVTVMVLNTVFVGILLYRRRIVGRMAAA